MREVRNSALSSSSSSDSGKLRDLVFFDDLLPHLFREMRRKIWNKFHLNVIVFIVIFFVGGGNKPANRIHSQSGGSFAAGDNLPDQWEPPMIKPTFPPPYSWIPFWFPSKCFNLVNQVREKFLHWTWLSSVSPVKWAMRGGGEGRAEMAKVLFILIMKINVPPPQAVTFSTALIS